MDADVESCSRFSANLDLDDLYDIENTIQKLNIADAESEYTGWNSPLKPCRRSRIKTYVESDPTKTIKNNRDLNYTVQALREENIMDSSIKLKIATPKIMNNSKLSQNKVNQIKLTDNQQIQSVKSSSKKRKETELPFAIIEKLKIAEKQLELQLARERHESVAKLRAVLEKGKESYREELDRKIALSWEEIQTSKLQVLHDHFILAAKSLFTPQTAAKNNDSNQELGSVVSSDEKLLIDQYLTKLKSEVQVDLAKQFQVITAKYVQRAEQEEIEQASILKANTLSSSSPAHEEKEIVSIIDFMKDFEETVNSFASYAHLPVPDHEGLSRNQILLLLKQYCIDLRITQQGLLAEYQVLSRNINK